MKCEVLCIFCRTKFDDILEASNFFIGKVPAKISTKTCCI